MCNFLNPKEYREKLAENHCAAIAAEAYKILKTNIENLYISLGKKDESQNSLSLIDEILANNKTSESGVKSYKISEEDFGKIKRNLFQNLGDSKSDQADKIFKIYRVKIAEAIGKRAELQETMEEMENLKNEYGEKRLLLEYAKVRVVYALEWLARVKLLGNAVESFSPDFSEKYLFNKDGGTVGEEISQLKKSLLKQSLTTLIGASLNQMAKDKDGRNGKYLVALDTEFHDYPKLLIRSLLTISVGSLVYDLLENSELSKEETEDLRKNISKLTETPFRFLSGSHIAMRLSPEELTKALESALKKDIDADEAIEGKKESRPNPNVEFPNNIANQLDQNLFSFSK